MLKYGRQLPRGNFVYSCVPIHSLHLETNCVTAVQLGCRIVKAPSQTAKKYISLSPRKDPMGGSSVVQCIPKFIAYWLMKIWQQTEPEEHTVKCN